MEYPVSFGAYIKQRRRALDISQEMLAELASCSVETIRKLEAHKRRPSRPFAARLASVLGIAPADHQHFIAIARAVQSTPAPSAEPLAFKATSIFIGRLKECAEIAELLDRVRLLTLTGMGGIGKSALARQVVAARSAAYPEGYALVDLAAIRDPAQIVRDVLVAFGAPSNHQSLADLRVLLQPKQSLLVLDNCEHVASACASLALELLSTCPWLQIMATSRRILGCYGETIYDLPPLALPEAGIPLTTDTVASYDAVALFLNCLRLHTPKFVITTESAAQIAGLCRVLDGLPLALELAAARLRDQSFDQLLASLDQRYGVLVNPNSSSPRQQSLRTVIDWSYHLLTGEEQRIVRRLAVFRGGWSLAGARAMAVPQVVSDDEMLLVMGGLIEKSFVALDHSSGAVRYRMSETLCAYVRECLIDQDEAESLRKQFAEYYLELAQAANRGFLSSEQAWWLNQIEAEQTNIQEVLRWAFETRRIELGLLIGGALWRFWYLRGNSESYQWLPRFVDQATAIPPTITYLQALNGIGNIAHQHSEYGRAAVFHRQALDMARELDAQSNAASALNNLGRALHMQGKYDQAIAYIQESAALNEVLGESFAKAVSLGNLGTLHRDRGEYNLALAAYTSCLAIHRDASNTWGVSTALYRIGVLHHVQGHVVQAATFYQQSLSLRSTIRDNDGLRLSLYSLGLLALHKTEYAQARSLLEESLALGRCHEGLHRHERALILIALARLLGRQHEPDKAWATLRESVALQVGLGCPLLVAMLLEAMADLAQEGAWAVKCWVVAQAIRARLGTPLPPIEYSPPWGSADYNDRFQAEVARLGVPNISHEHQAEILDRIVTAMWVGLMPELDLVH